MSAEHQDKKQKLARAACADTLLLLGLPCDVWSEVLALLELGDILALASTGRQPLQLFESESEMWRGLAFFQEFKYWDRAPSAQKLLQRYRKVWSTAGVTFSCVELCTLAQLVWVNGLHFKTVNLLGFARKIQEVLEAKLPEGLQTLSLLGSLHADHITMYDLALKLEHWPQNVAGLDILCRRLKDFDRQELRMPPIPTLRSVRFSLTHPGDEVSPERLCREFLELPLAMEELKLVDCGFSPEQFRRLLARFRVLKKLVLVESQRPSSLANTDFAGCAGLHVLDVTGVASTGIGLLTHLDSKSLCKLYLRDCGWLGFGTADGQALPEPPALQTLRIDGPRSVISLRDLPPLCRLRALFLENLPAGQTLDLEHLVELELSELEELSIIFKIPIFVESPARVSNYYVLQHFPQLKVVTLANAASEPAMRGVKTWFERHLPDVHLE